MTIILALQEGGYVYVNEGYPPTFHHLPRKVFDLLPGQEEEQPQASWPGKYWAKSPTVDGATIFLAFTDEPPDK